MFGFPTDLFGLPNNNNNNNNNNNDNRRMNSHALIPHQSSLFGNSLMIPSPFAGINSLINNFGMNASPFAMMPDMNQNSVAPMQSFTSTTVMSYNGTDGRPKVYQETTARNRGPGGIEETRQAIRDTERGINKVQIGHRIGDRKHVIEREMNVETGQISENVELENLDEDETDDFKKEWRQRSAHTGLLRRPAHPYHRQINSNRLHHPSSRSQLAIEHGSSHRQHQRSAKHVNHPSSRPQLHHSDTIDLTEDTPVEDDVEEIEQLPLPVKRKVSSSSSNDINDQRKHRQNRS